MSQIETQRKGSIVKEEASAVLQKDKRGYRRNISILYILNTMVSLHFFGSVMIAFFEDWGGIDFAQIMLLESLFTGAIFVFEIPTGTIADKFGRKISMNRRRSRTKTYTTAKFRRFTRGNVTAGGSRYS